MAAIFQDGDHFHHFHAESEFRNTIDFIDIYCGKATQMEHWADSKISVSISVLYCIALYIFIIVACINKSE